jgi:acetoin utilization deacetylase AcuC-like enzyme
VVAENKPQVLLEKKVISKKLMNAEKVSASDSSLHFVSSSTFSAKKNSSALSLEKLKQKVFTEVSDCVEKKNETSFNSNHFTPAKMDNLAGRTIAFLYNEKHLKHESGPLSMKTPECPERLIKAMWHLKKSGVFDDDSCSLIDAFDAVDESYILQVHDESYVRFVDSYAKAGGGFLGDSTYVVSDSCYVAKCSAGGAIKAGDLVADGLYSYSFAMMRPPGHHASKGKYGGFCLFNNAAILAKYLQNEKKIGKVMIIDWDAHAGDGNMDIFYDDTTVLFVSLHRDHHGFYPRKGFTEETGAGVGDGYTVNVEMPPGSGDAEYIFAFDEVIVPLIDNFSPDFIICSCGFDAHYKEKNIGLNMTSEGYYQMTLRLSSKYPKNLAFLMEGGYHDFNGQLCHSVLNALLGKPNPTHDQVQVSSFKLDRQKQIFGQTQAKIAQLKKIIPLLS